jgi:RimJ/RimL family protein N-acetyltransferase
MAGNVVSLRSAVPADAEFILSLRLDPVLSRFLTPTNPSVDAQRAWLAAKLDQPGDYHFLIQGIDGSPLGTVAVYDIDARPGCFEWGRWILARAAPAFAAMESAMLAYHFAFHRLGLRLAEFGVMRENTGVVQFHRRMGSTETASNELGYRFSFDPEQYARAYAKFAHYLPASVAPPGCAPSRTVTLQGNRA